MPSDGLPLPIYIVIGLFTIGTGLYATVATGDAIWGITFGILGVLQIYVSVLAAAETAALDESRAAAATQTVDEEVDDERDDERLGSDGRMFFLTAGSALLGAGVTTLLVEVPGLSPMIATLGAGMVALAPPLAVAVSPEIAGSGMLCAFGVVSLLVVVVDWHAPAEREDAWERENL